MKILITGCAGFIGFHLSKYLIKQTKHKIFGIDNLNAYYDVNLKKDRLKILKKNKNRFTFFKINIANKKKINENFLNNSYDIVIHLAAQAGVRHSIQQPDDYLQSNVVGFFNIIEASKKIAIKHFLFASTSSVYGAGKKFPLKEEYNTDKPLSFYAATKKSNEIMAFTYSNIHKLKCTGLRFFTVYGPYGRPDMALYKFAEKINKGKNIELYNYGKHERDFTYIDDVVKSISKLINKPSKDKIPYNILNVAGSDPQKLTYFLKEIENAIGKKAKIKYRGLQQGDVIKTYASSTKLKRKIGFLPRIKIEKGINFFISWYLNYNKKKSK